MKQLARKIKKILKIFENILYYLIITTLLCISLMVIYQDIKYPDKIPNVFGWKIFMILDDKMDKNLQYGDLVFTKNIDSEKLQKGNIIAFRNINNTVTIHEIKELERQSDKLIFIMEAAENETNDTKTVEQTKVEGILRKRIPYVGTIIMFIQQPLALFAIICIILVVGLICLYIAQKLDEKEQKNKI